MSNFKENVAPWVGLLAIVAFGILLKVMLSHTGDTDLQWSRKVYLFGAVEAIALAATGFFFGKDVNRQRAEKAEEQAASARSSAQSAQGGKAEAEQKLRDLVNFIDTKAGSRRNSSTREQARSGISLEEERTGPGGFAMEGGKPGGPGGRSDDDYWNELVSYARALADPGRGS
jgi:hypothetical protein